MNKTLLILNFLGMNYYNYFVTKKSLNNIPYKKFLTSSNNSQNNIHYLRHTFINQK